jgi:hypothetical protein
VTSTSALDKSESVIAALEALRSRVADDDRATLADAQDFIGQVKELVKTLDGQLEAMRWLAQKQYRPKTDKVPEGQLALDLLGYLLAQRGGKTEESASAPAEQDNEPPKDPPREKRKSKLHLVPVVVVRKELPEEERMCEDCGVPKTEFATEPRRALIYEPPQAVLS